jgi:hypothetical protein
MEASTTMRKSFAITFLLITPLLLLGLAGVTQALTLYDDFNVKPINPAKWYGDEVSLGPNSPNTEATRKIANAKLEIDLTTWGWTSSDLGYAPGTPSFRLSITNPAPITTIQADVTVKSAKVVGCAANPVGTRARASVLGFFFNDGTSPGPGDRTGDIGATIESRRDSITGDQIVASIFRCGSSDCTAFITTVAFHAFTAVWTKGVADTLRIQWDAANDRFIFDLNPGGPNPETANLSYTSSDAAPAVGDRRALRAANTVASCQSGPRGSATIKALFDNVMINP